MGIKGYQVPVLDDEGRVIRKAIEGKEELVEDIELGEGVLKVNVGIPIIILCTKVIYFIYIYIYIYINI